MSLISPLVTSGFIDFSDQISEKTRSLFYLNKKDQNHQMIAESRGISSTILAIPEQIHSNEITCIDAPGEYFGIDGLITDNPEIILTIKVADCVPVYLYESTSRIIGLVHSGWRGTVGGIISNAVRKMLEIGAKENEISVFLGPAIGFCCYLVDEEVAGHFNKKAKKKLENGKWNVGLHNQIYLQLTRLGIPSANIRFSDICTYESIDCHSYRRDGTQAKRMVAYMGMKS